MPIPTLTVLCSVNTGNRLTLTDCGNGEITCTFLLGDSPSGAKTIVTVAPSLSFEPLLQCFNEADSWSGSCFNPEAQGDPEPLLLRCRCENFMFYLLPPSEGDEYFEPMNGILPDVDNVPLVADFLKKRMRKAVRYSYAACAIQPAQCSAWPDKLTAIALCAFLLVKAQPEMVPVDKGESAQCQLNHYPHHAASMLATGCT